MFDTESAEVDDWTEIEGSIAALRPELLPLEPLLRCQIEERLLYFCNRRDAERDAVPKSELLREHDLLIKRSAQMIQALEIPKSENSSYFLLNPDGSQSEEEIHVRDLIRILESIYWTENSFARFIEKAEDPDPVPARKRLGISLFLLGERALGLSSKRTTPHDRGAAVPSGALFGFVSAVMNQVDEKVSATTLEQWSRDAQLAKRAAAAHKSAEVLERQRLRELVAKHGDPFPDAERPGTYLANAPHRDWLFPVED